LYETLVMIKPSCSFGLDEMDSLIHEVAKSGNADYERQDQSFIIRHADAYLQVDFHSASFIQEESQEIADDCGLDCAGCRERYEMEGDDPDMELFNDYVLINKRLQATGKFIIFDQVEGKQFGS